jgi:hypothetical protein
MIIASNAIALSPAHLDPVAAVPWFFQLELHAANQGQHIWTLKADWLLLHFMARLLASMFM